MKVELIETAGGDLSIVNSARVSFAKESKKFTGNDERLVRYLAKHKHMTPFRHNFIQLRCSAPVFLARQLMKHQAGLTWNEVSRRYVDDMPEFYYPDEWRSRPENGIKQGSGAVLPEVITGEDDFGVYEFSIKDAYALHIDYCIDLFEQMLKENIAPEMARMVLPQSMMVDFIWSGNLLAFSHVYNLRSGEGAQVEAREFAELLDKVIAPEFPVGWDALTFGA